MNVTDPPRLAVVVRPTARRVRLVLRRGKRSARAMARWGVMRVLTAVEWFGSRVYLPVWDRFRAEQADEGVEEIHLINPLRTLYGGGPLRTIALFNELRQYREVRLWSQAPPTSKVADLVPLQRISPLRRQFPRRGTFVIVGSYFTVGSWLRYARPRRIILVHNNNLTLDEFDRLLSALSTKSDTEVEIVYTSEFTRTSIGRPGHVEPSLIDIERFVPASPPRWQQPTTTFTVGRLSRSDPKKHHPDDAALYRRIVAAGCEVRIMGPSLELEAAVGDVPGVTLIPGWGQSPEYFLQGLDCFFYRTAEEWPEPWGRVVTEAMSCGLPVVCERRGGYVEIIDDGRNGFLFERPEEAFEIILRLKADRRLRGEIGTAARRTVEAVFSTARRRELVEFYVQ